MILVFCDPLQLREYPLAQPQLSRQRVASNKDEKCASWAVGQYTSYKGACAKEVGACKARCKQGQKYFLGVLVGNQYPIDTCN